MKENNERNVKLYSPFNYPVAEKEDVKDNFHGTIVPDPYRWLEDENSTETQAWVKAQNEITENYLKDTGLVEDLEIRLSELWNYTRFGQVDHLNDYYYYWKNDGLQNQPIYYRQHGIDGTPEKILDPNNFSEDGTVAVTSNSLSKDGKYLAYAVAQAGSDWQEIHFLEIETGKVLSDVLNWCRFVSDAWYPDNKGIFYNRFPDPGTVAPEDRINYNRVYFHVIGSDQSEDKLIFEQLETKEYDYYPVVTDDGKYLVLSVHHGTNEKNGIYFTSIDKIDKFQHLLELNEAVYEFIGNEGALFYFRTNLSASRSKIIAIDCENPSRENWQEIIPEQDDILQMARIIDKHLITITMHHVVNKLSYYSLKGEFLGTIPIPDNGSVVGLASFNEKNELLLTFVSFTSPVTVYSYDFSQKLLTEFFRPKFPIDKREFETKQVFYKSKDGTKIPMFIVSKKNLPLNGENPTILYGYGGFSISLTPFFSTSIFPWIEKGGVFAVANIRGGSEYGEKWHKEGMLEKKQNVFDDFIAAAEFLINEKITSSKHLAIEGGSNGGLLVGACMVQRPDLYGAVLCEVPVLDMLRYTLFTVGRYWKGEYGEAANPKHFPFLYAYSPLHNIESGKVYPPVMVRTADHDDRVVPAHAKKFVATLQEKASSKNPILLAIDTRSGHGLGKPIAKLINEKATNYAFLLHELT